MEQSIMQNLIDAGCGEDTVSQFMKLYIKSNKQGALKLIAGHRKVLLENLRRCQKQIDCLDYLLYTISKEE